jgi:hypothetical protein
MLSSSLLSLASQFTPDGPSSARFYLLDGTPEDSPWASEWAGIADVLPHLVRRGGRADAAAVLSELAQEVNRRVEGEGVAGPELFLLLADLGRFRDLKRSDDYDFATTRDPLAPPAAIETILREGPSVGVHILAWCDGLSNLNRVFNRAAQREFGARVALQMSASDSAVFLDAPQASRLGQHRAFFVDEQQGAMEKFRPYSVPAREWLTWVRGCFDERKRVSSR